MTRSPRIDIAKLGPALAAVAEEASAVILPFWRADAAVERKADDSPVTEADRRAEALVLQRLAALYPGVPVVAEEDVCANGAPAEAPKRFFLVDALDGTKAFVAGRETFTVNIAFVDGGRAVAGAVAAPASGLVWFTTGEGAARRKFGETAETPVRVRSKADGGGLALVSNSLTDAEAERLARRHGCDQWRGMDSSVKFCLVAQGHADVYPRSGPTNEWDTAAAHAVLEAAGGRVLADDGSPLRYGKADRGWINPGFLAFGA